MDGFSRYNQLQIKTEDQHQNSFIFPWDTFLYKNIPFGLKNVEATFQQAMNFTFHDIKHIVDPYLDDIPAHSRKRKDHPTHLQLVFEWYTHYMIHLNPHNVSFVSNWDDCYDLLCPTKELWSIHSNLRWL